MPLLLDLVADVQIVDPLDALGHVPDLVGVIAPKHQLLCPREREGGHHDILVVDDGVGPDHLEIEHLDELIVFSILREIRSLISK